MRLIPIIIVLLVLRHVEAVQWCEKDVYEMHINDDGRVLEVLTISYPIRSGISDTLQLCSNHTGLPIARHCSFNDYGLNATWDRIDKQIMFVNCSIIYNKCKAESFEHYFVKEKKEKIKFTNRWNPAKLGEFSQPHEICLLSTGLPLTRRCLYNPKHYTANWEVKDTKDIKCLHEVRQNIITYDLNKLYEDVRGSPELNSTESLRVVSRIINLLAKANTVRIAADLEISTNILKILTEQNRDPQLMLKILEVTNLLMESDETVIDNAKSLDTSNTLIRTLEKYHEKMANTVVPTSKCNEVPDGVYYKSTNLTSVFYINPFCSNISGIAIYNTSAHPTASMHYDSASKSYFRYVYMHESIEKIIDEPYLQAAAYIPESLWYDIVREVPNVEAVRFSLYRNKNFFIDEARNNGHEPDSVVLTISVPHYKGDLTNNVPVVLQPYGANDEVTPTCRYWNYHTWQSSGITTTKSPLGHKNLILCNTAHLTPLAAVVGAKARSRQFVRRMVLTVAGESPTDLVSIASCGLSLLGLLCIWMTALCCSHWRSQTSNKLLWNLCLVLSLIMVYFLFINMSKIRDAVIDIKNHHHCEAMGAFLHYTVLVLFLWMLFIAVLQYQRYVSVVGVIRPRHFVAKYALAAWTLPIVPTALLVYFDPNSYVPMSEDGICYPTGIGLYVAVMLPISLISAANLGILFYILCNIRKALKHFKLTKKRQNEVVQVRISIVLFLLLVISLAFGIMAHLKGSLVYSFLFLLTSTLQGFMLFIYFAVIDNNAQFSWLGCFLPKDYFKLDDTTMSPLTEL